MALNFNYCIYKFPTKDHYLLHNNNNNLQLEEDQDYVFDYV